ncbi:MAG: hypothetical protein ACI4IL_07585 [Eubacterium sp.]
MVEKINHSQLPQSTTSFSNEPIDEPVKESTIDFSSFAPKISDEVKPHFLKQQRKADISSMSSVSCLIRRF